jgi:hypothetical protein
MDSIGDIIAWILLIVGTGLCLFDFSLYYGDYSGLPKWIKRSYIWYGLLCLILGLMWFTGKLISTKLD